MSVFRLNSNKTIVQVGPTPKASFRVSTAARGPRGPQGPIGPQGPVGPEGQQGIQGEKGDPGNGAYTDWLEDGNEGTIEEFLATLVGPEGPQGPQGIQGIQGIQGEKGDKGDQGEQGEIGAGLNILGQLPDPSELPPTGTLGDGYLIDGDLYVWDGDSWENVGHIEGPEGPEGPQGPQGIQGIQGVPGDPASNIITSVNGEVGDVVIPDEVAVGDTEPEDDEKIWVDTDDDDADALVEEVADHISDTENPHEVTKAQVGLGDVENMSLADIIAASGQANFPVGTIYHNQTDSRNPSEYLPGMSGTTWEAVEDVVIVGKGSGTFATAGDTGGDEAHVHTLDGGDSYAYLRLTSSNPFVAGKRTEVPQPVYDRNYQVTQSSGAGGSSMSESPLVQHAIQLGGETNPGSNLMPFKVAYVWERTA